MSSTSHYVLTDNLLGLSVTTSASGAQEEMIDYLPYGSIRLNEKSGTYTDQRKYAGSEHDTESGLNYMNARYYESTRGQFISQDPVFWEVGQTKDGKEALTNPQAMNSYAYANDNPIINRDPSGRWVSEVLSRKQSWSSFQKELGQATMQMTQDSAAWNIAISHPYLTGVATGAVVGVGSVVAGSQLLQAYGYYDTVKNVQDFREQLHTSPTNYTESEQRMTAGTMFVDVLGRVVSLATPAPARQTYEAVRSVLDSAVKVSQSVDVKTTQSQEKPQPKQNKQNK